MHVVTREGHFSSPHLRTTRCKPSNLDERKLHVPPSQPLQLEIQSVKKDGSAISDPYLRQCVYGAAADRGYLDRFAPPVTATSPDVLFREALLQQPQIVTANLLRGLCFHHRTRNLTSSSVLRYTFDSGVSVKQIDDVYTQENRQPEYHPLNRDICDRTVSLRKTSEAALK